MVPTWTEMSSSLAFTSSQVRTRTSFDLLAEDEDEDGRGAISWRQLVGVHDSMRAAFLLGGTHPGAGAAPVGLDGQLMADNPGLDDQQSGTTRPPPRCRRVGGNRPCRLRSPRMVTSARCQSMSSTRNAARSPARSPSRTKTVSIANPVVQPRFPDRRTPGVPLDQSRGISAAQPATISSDVMFAIVAQYVIDS